MSTLRCDFHGAYESSDGMCPACDIVARSVVAPEPTPPLSWRDWQELATHHVLATQIETLMAERSALRSQLTAAQEELRMRQEREAALPPPLVPRARQQPPSPVEQPQSPMERATGVRQAKPYWSVLAAIVGKVKRDV